MTDTPLTPVKPKRQRRPWVYQDDYDALFRRYQNLKSASVAGWALALLLSIAMIKILLP